MGIEALRLYDVKQRLSKIEAFRQRLLEDKSPLVTGDLTAGIFDEKSSVADAVAVSKKKINAEHLFSYTVLTEAKCCIEIGTNVGISSSYIGTALDAGGPDWQLHTLESSPYRIRLAKALHRDLGLSGVRYHCGLFYETLPTVLAQLDRKVDLAFIDGQHQYQPTLDFFDMIHAYSTANALFIFDDIEWSDGMKDAWKVIQTDPRVVTSSSIAGVGFVITKKV